VSSPARGFAFIVVAYVVALAAAFAVMRASVSPELLVRCALADLAATAVVFAFSVIADNTSVYDPYWSVMPPVLASFLLAQSQVTARGVLVLVLISVWGARLTFNWARGWRGLAHEDWRYVAFRRLGRGYWPMSFFGLQLFPTLMTFLGCLPLFFSTGSVALLSAVDLAAAVVTLGATAIEAIADEQLRAFRRQGGAAGGICERGLWRWSRHPNYFGEISFWAGLELFGLAAGAPWWTAAGLLAMIALFVFASIPLAEKRSLERRPGFAAHKRRVSMLIPLPRSRETPAPRVL
jgi:steroid 5-alpha reductase family enzyme